MERALAAPDPVPGLFALLGDGETVPDAELPDTGVGLEWERRLSAALITGPDYGTRASTVLAVGADGGVRLEERSRGPDGAETTRANHAFRQMAGPQAMPRIAPPPMPRSRS
jgi:uncharacterized protein with NRDE domain